MGISELQYREMLARTERNRARAPEISEDAVEHEITGLHEPIIAWCREQWPPVPYIHTRTDKRSTIAEGAPDFVIFHKERVLLVECKTRSGKLSTAQMAWRAIAEQQGFKVHVIRSMKEFLALVLNRLSE